MHDDLVKRLRSEADCPDNFPEDSNLMHEAADAIEKLLSERDEVNADSWKRRLKLNAMKNIVFEALNNAIADCNSTPFGEALCTFIAKNIVDEIEAAPTIIPADGADGKDTNVRARKKGFPKPYVDKEVFSRRLSELIRAFEPCPDKYDTAVFIKGVFDSFPYISVLEDKDGVI